jgi:hypothetical protein
MASYTQPQPREGSFQIRQHRSMGLRFLLA